MWKFKKECNLAYDIIKGMYDNFDEDIVNGKTKIEATRFKSSGKVEKFEISREISLDEKDNEAEITIIFDSFNTLLVATYDTTKGYRDNYEVDFYNYGPITTMYVFALRFKAKSYLRTKGITSTKRFDDLANIAKKIKSQNN